MIEHEMLEKICNNIGYKIPFHKTHTNSKKPNEFVYAKPAEFGENGGSIVDVREIIFTEEFMDLLKKYYIENINDCGDKTFPGILKMSNDFLGILENLNNPVQYLYNLLELYNNLLPKE